MRPVVVAWLDQFLPHSVSALIAPSWFTMVGLAGVVTLFVMMAIAKRHGIDRGLVASIVLWCYVAAVLAGIVVPMTIDAIEGLFATGQLRLHWAGMTSFWGYLAGFAAVAIVCKRNALPLARFGDLTAAPLGLALAFARVGCFLGGCDYGKVTSLPWGMRFPRGSAAFRDHVQAGLLPADRAESLPVHPTQLYEALLGIAIAAIALCVMRTAWAKRGAGRVFVVAAAVYAIGRLVIESLRGDLERGIYGGLSSGQLFSIAVLIAIAIGHAIARHRVELARAAAATTAVLVIVLTTDAHAQVPAQPLPAPAPAPAPAPVAQPLPQPAAAATVQAKPEDTMGLQLGALLGFATPINRRAEQVAALGGPSISVGYATDRFGLWLDLDSFGNADATHGTVLLSAGLMSPGGQKLRFGGRIGLGATLVNFDEPAFRDVAGTTIRFEGVMEYAATERWLIEVRPIAIDILTAADLGGPITTFQMRAGVAYKFGVASKDKPTPQQPPQYQYPPQQYPPQQYPPAPYPYPQPYPPPQPYPQPQPYPPPQQQPQPYPPPQQQPQPQQPHAAAPSPTLDRRTT